MEKDSYHVIQIHTHIYNLLFLVLDMYFITCVRNITIYSGPMVLSMLKLRICIVRRPKRFSDHYYMY